MNRPLVAAILLCLLSFSFAYIWGTTNCTTGSAGANLTLTAIGANTSCYMNLTGSANITYLIVAGGGGAASGGTGGGGACGGGNGKDGLGGGGGVASGGSGGLGGYGVVVLNLVGGMGPLLNSTNISSVGTGVSPINQNSIILWNASALTNLGTFQGHLARHIKNH